MKKLYDHIQVEEKWQHDWEEKNLFQNSDTVPGGKEVDYLLFAFAYPSGSGLHVGHVESKTALDILARYKRMNGKHVFFPVGWDAFGLPAENYAVKTGVPPAVTTKNAIDTFRAQIKRLGISYDWANELATNHPEYYKWTQWLFLQMYQKGLAYRGIGMVNWCPQDQTVLANEQVVNGKCERCSTEVIQKKLEQWYFKITEYKDQLLDDLSQVDWPEATKQQQIHWIGKSKGLTINFTLKQDAKKVLPIWTKFWETIFGTTFLVIAPEKFNEFGLMELVSQDNKAAVEKYLEQSFKKTEEERKIGEKNKTGVDTGLTVVHPITSQEVPLFIADYVLINVGTGVVMGVPAHDERDFQFAKKFNLPLIQVVEYQDEQTNHKVAAGEISFEGEGLLVNSGDFSGLSAWGEGKEKMAEWMIQQGYAQWQTTYKLRDWLISRQRYWGAPIPVVYDPEGNPHPVKEEHLPWMLPTDADFKPTGESPLKRSKEFFERTERLYGKGWTPECDTMDTFVDSSWYYLRYVDSRNTSQFADSEKIKHLLPVNLYLIGPEHIVLHLLYSRFFTKFLRDEGYLDFDEPFMKMRHQGMILGPDGKKMSKSKGNVITPDEIIEKYGADTLRVYEMFMGPLESDKPWDTGSVIGIYRFLQRIHQMSQEGVTPSSDKSLVTLLHQTIKKVTEDIPALKFNTAIAALMIFMNEWESALKKTKNGLSEEDMKKFIKMLAPFAPFISEEIYHSLLKTDNALENSVHISAWPSYDPNLIQKEVVQVAVQVNGKLRGQIDVETREIDNTAYVVEKAKGIEQVAKWLEDKKILKEVYVKGKILNFVVQ